MFCQNVKSLQNICKEVHQPLSNPDSFTHQTRVEDVQMKAESTELTRRAENLCAAVIARNKALLERQRFTLQDGGLLKPTPSGSPKRSTRYPEGKYKHFYERPSLDDENFDIAKYLEDLEKQDSDSWDFYGYRLPKSEEVEKKISNLPSQVPAPPVVRALVSKPPKGPQRDKEGAQTRRRLPPVKTVLKKQTEDLNQNTIPQAQSRVSVKEAPVHVPLAPKPPTEPKTMKAGAQARRFLPPLKLTVKGTDEVSERDIGLQKANDTKDKAGKQACSNTDSFPKSRLPILVKGAPVMAPLGPSPPKDPRTNKRGARQRHFLPPVNHVNDTKVKELKIEEQEGLKLNSIPQCKLPIPDKRPPVLPPLAPKPPTKPRPKREERQFMPALKPALKEIDKKAVKDSRRRIVKYKIVKRNPLNFVEKDMDYSFQVLSSNDRTKKIEALRIMQALVQHHFDLLKPRLHEACLLLVKQVRNHRYEITCEAMNTLAVMYTHLQRLMDPEVTLTGQALLLRLADTSNDVILERANAVLDVMVENCHYTWVLDALLNKGLRHISSLVRCSVAQHLHQLFDKMGAFKVVTVGRGVTERFIPAVAKLSVDAVLEVRFHGQAILHQMVNELDFDFLWKRLVPKRERLYLEGFINMAKY